MTGRPLRGAVLLAPLLAVLVAGCGVSLQAAPEPIPPDVLPSALPVPASTPASTPSESAAPASESPSPSAPAAPDDVGSLRLWFVQRDGLSAVESRLPVGSSPELVMRALMNGPTPVEAAWGLRTIASDPLTGRPLAVAVGPPIPEQPGSAVLPVTVELSEAFTSLPPTEQVLLLGQVVLSLTGAGQPSVIFVDESGAPLAVPLPDGRLLDGPALARDFGPLIYRP